MLKTVGVNGIEFFWRYDLQIPGLGFDDIDMEARARIVRHARTPFDAGNRPAKVHGSAKRVAAIQTRQPKELARGLDPAPKTRNFLCIKMLARRASGTILEREMRIFCVHSAQRGQIRPWVQVAESTVPALDELAGRWKRQILTPLGVLALTYASTGIAGVRAGHC